MRWNVDAEPSKQEAKLAARLERGSKFFSFLWEIRAILFTPEFQDELIEGFERKRDDNHHGPPPERGRSSIATTKSGRSTARSPISSTPSPSTSAGPRGRGPRDGDAVRARRSDRGAGALVGRGRGRQRPPAGAHGDHGRSAQAGASYSDSTRHRPTASCAGPPEFTIRNERGPASVPGTEPRGRAAGRLRWEPGRALVRRQRHRTRT